MKLDDEMKRRWRIIFEENDGGVDDNKELIHAKRWDVCMNQRENIIKGGYLVEVVGYDGNKILWEVIEDHVSEEENDHDEIGLQGFNFNLS